MAWFQPEGQSRIEARFGLRFYDSQSSPKSSNREKHRCKNAGGAESMKSAFSGSVR